VRKLRAIRPDMAMSSDFIVGFPGETDEDHAKTMKLIDDIGFDNSFSFIFSPRPGTPAANLHDELMGRTECHRAVNFPGGPNAARLVGRMIDVTITEAMAHSLRGEICVKDGALAA
jgi:tRNA-2-methylthio-N6-dimethylallyladenosine synthase